jgi:hypothetical protein
MLRRRTLVATLGTLVLVACAALAAPAQADHRLYGWQHWSDGAGGGPGYVTIADYTGSQWPVYSAAIEWDRAASLNMVYQSGGCGGYGHCIGVRAYEFSQSCATYAGYFQAYGNSNGTHYGDSSYVRFNTRCNDRADREQRVITCHELGHVSSLGEENEAFEGQTCMAAQAGELGQASHTPRAHDFEAIANVYGHAD